MATANTQDEPKATGPLKIKVAGVERVFDIDNPVLPDWVDHKTVSTGGFPYDKKMDEGEYEKTLERLQVELVKLQAWQQLSGSRVLILFEGRDARRQRRDDQRSAAIYEPPHGPQRGAD